MLQIKLEPSAAAKLPVGAAERAQLKVYCNGPQPPIKSKIRITKPITGEQWLLKPGDRLPTDHCGGLSVQLYRPVVFDYLGLFGLRVRESAERTVLVWPEPLDTGIPSDLTQHLALSWRPKPGGGYAENHEIRQYHPGDNLNQIHWKLSAKVGDLMLREPMEPERGSVLLTMDLMGTPEELDTKFGQLLWMSKWLLENGVSFEVCVLTGNGIESWIVSDEWSLQKCVQTLLSAPFAQEGSVRNRSFAAWQHHIGGEPDEE